MYPGQVLTCGEYATEPDSVAALLAIINLDHWRVRQEVPGFLLHPRLDTDGTNSVQIDMLLEPTAQLMSYGWRWGMTGIECKRSGVKVGRVVSQAMDYTRCAWRLPSGFHVMTRIVFIWPCEYPKSDIESVMVQHCIGVAHERSYGGAGLCLRIGGTLVYSDNGENPPHIANDIPGGRKKGSR